MQQLFALVEDVSPATKGNPKTRVNLLIQYGPKQSRLELEVGEPQFEGEPGTEIYARSLQEFLEALQELAKSPQKIAWPLRRQNEPGTST